MTLTNRLDLPRSIVAAVTNDPYTKGASDISVTSLISPPYLVKLRKSVEVIEDVSDRIWSLLGQSVHNVLERAYPEGSTDSIVEERIFTAVNGWIISGQNDVLEAGVLSDFKVTSVWGAKGKIEWEQQLNLLTVLCARQYEQTGDERYIVTKAQIIAIYRDWIKSKSKSADYPDCQVGVIPIKLWGRDEQERYLLERVLAHQDENPPPCSDFERWKMEDVYAVMKDGRKSAVKLHDNLEDAESQMVTLGKGHSVVLRAGGYRRCADYCNVSHACPVYQSEVPF